MPPRSGEELFLACRSPFEVHVLPLLDPQSRFRLAVTCYSLRDWLFELRHWQVVDLG